MFDSATARRHVVHARRIVAGELVEATVTAEPEEVLELPIEPKAALNFALQHFSDLPAPVALAVAAGVVAVVVVAAVAAGGAAGGAGWEVW